VAKRLWRRSVLTWPTKKQHRKKQKKKLRQPRGKVWLVVYPPTLQRITVASIASVAAVEETAPVHCAVTLANNCWHAVLELGCRAMDKAEREDRMKRAEQKRKEDDAKRR
jgi:hypothetical protein